MKTEAIGGTASGRRIGTMGTRYLQIGTIAARDPETGEFLQSIPIFREIPEGSAAASTATNDVARLFAEKMKQYIDGGGRIERAAGKRNGASR